MGVIGCATKAGLFKIKAIELKIICAAGYATQMPVNAKSGRKDNKTCRKNNAWLYVYQ